jgi:uncharacterized membrane protein YhaH (DUF805 family)/ribosomal protein L37AE/L43A
MNVNNNETSSAELSLQPREISLQARAIVCPKCQHQRTASDHGPDWQCPGCGVAYNKAAPSTTVTHQAASTPGPRVRQEINRDPPETATPGVFSLSLEGRIGRLRYLAFYWPTFLLSGMLGLMAMLTDSLHKKPSMILIVLVGVLWLWMPLRLMALRMHDLNQSAKWLLALILLPGLSFAMGQPQMGMVLTGVFWLVALLLICLPGSESENEYGPPPGANTTWVTVGATLFLAFMALGVVGDIKLMHSGKLHAGLAKAPSTTQGQPDLNRAPGPAH